MIRDDHYLQQPRRRRRRKADLDLDDAASGVGIEPVFQPIVSLPSGATVGFEALARWPGMPGCTPKTVFDHATATGTLTALDHACIGSALAAARSARLHRDALLCVNTEPSTPYLGRSEDAEIALAYDELTVMFEITERSLLAHPQTLLRKAAALRADGFAIALDDVGAQPESLPLLDIILPDVIKLDLSLVQRQPTQAQAQTLDAVLAHHERTNATILAEGIETEEHLEQALTLGAELGQGFLFGRPGPLGDATVTAWCPSAQRLTHDAGMASPFDLVAGTLPARTARKQTLIALTRHIEGQAARAADPPMVFTALQREDYFRDATRDRYLRLAVSCPMVAVFGCEMPEDLGPGIRGVALQPSDPLCREWTVISLGPHNATALIAREHDDNDDHLRSDGDRRFDFVITYDRPLISAAVRGLLDRMN